MWVNDPYNELRDNSNRVINRPKIAPVGRITHPSWGCHISVIRRERPSRNANLWGHGVQDIPFQWDPCIWYNNEYFWVYVYCDELLDLRERYGLPRAPRMPLHLTLARWAEHVPAHLTGQKVAL